MKTRLSTVLCVSATALLFCDAASAAKLRADAAANFLPGAFAGDTGTNPHPDSIGTGSWQYAASPNSNPTIGGLTSMSWDTGCIPGGGYDMGPTDGFCNYPLAMREAGSSVELHPSSSQFAVLRWTATEPGLVLIMGNFRKSDILSDGDGVEVFIYIDGVERFQADIENDDAVGFDYNILEENLSAGSTVDFVIGADGPGTGAPLTDGDTTYLDATIINCPVDFADGPGVGIQEFLKVLAWWGDVCP